MKGIEKFSRKLPGDAEKYEISVTPRVLSGSCQKITGFFIKCSPRREMKDPVFGNSRDFERGETSSFLCDLQA